MDIYVPYLWKTEMFIYKYGTLIFVKHFVFHLLEQKAYSISFIKALLGFVWVTKYVVSPASFEFFSSSLIFYTSQLLFYPDGYLPFFKKHCVAFWLLPFFHP